MMRFAAVMVSMALLGQAQGAEPTKHPDAGADETASQASDATDQQARQRQHSRPPRSPRGSWDVPKVNTRYGQQSATYEDVIGTRTPMPGIVVPAPDSNADAQPRRQGDDQKP
jgi:RES domain-containing protein